MAATTTPAPAAAPHRPPGPPDPFRHLGPNWHAAVMGTAIVANAARALPLRVPGLGGLAVAVWALSFAMLTALTAARAVHFARDEGRLRAQLLDPATAVFYGCPPMALLAVGYGTLTAGGPVLGPDAAVAMDAALWTAGTLYALAAAAGIPYLMVTRYRFAAGSAHPTWLLPVVAPMVSAALGPALVPHLPAGAWRSGMVYACYAMFGMSLLGTLVILPGVWSRLTRGTLPLAATPALFLVLGPLGQSTTAAGQLADAAGAAAPRYAEAMRAFGVLYGVPVLGFALLWLAVAAAANLRALRGGMPFTLTWWAFTFPVGTCVTGAAVLARHTGLPAFAVLAAALYALLLTAWAAATTGTVRGLAATVRRG